MVTPHNQLDIRQAPTAFDWANSIGTFQHFTTPVIVPTIFQACMPELASGAWEITTGSVGDTKLRSYLRPESKIKSTLSICYQATIRHTATGKSSQLILYAKVFLKGRSRDAFQQLIDQGWCNPEFPKAVTHVPDLDMIVWRFPYDPGLPHLHRLMDPQTTQEYVPSDALIQIGMSETPLVITSYVVNYQPEVRCLNRYELYDPIHNRTCQLFGKTFRSSEGESLYARLQYFWERSLTDPNAMAVAQPLGYAAPVKTVWQLGVPGTPLLQELTPSTYEAYLTELARGLASLHRSTIAGLQTHSVTDHLVKARNKLSKLSDAIPSLSETCTAIAKDLEHTAPPSSQIPSRPIHCDFHIQQILVYQKRLVLCDFDDVVIGDPVQDLVNFIVDLHFRNLDQHFVQRVATELCHTYRRQVEWDVPPERVTWHTRLQFINKAYRHYRRFAPGFESAVEQMLQLAKKGFCL